MYPGIDSVAFGLGLEEIWMKLQHENQVRDIKFTACFLNGNI